MNELVNAAETSLIPRSVDAVKNSLYIPSIRTMRRRTAVFAFRLSLVLGALSPIAVAQTSGQWDWVAPADTSAAGMLAYSFGTAGVPDPSNSPPKRWGTSTWTDANGKFWMFGGGTPTILSNDMWEFDPATGLWTCMSGVWALDPNFGTVRPLPASFGTLGVPAASNLPPGRTRAASWIDSSGKLWLFGGSSTALTGFEYNDLWVFDPSTKFWTWMGGGTTTKQLGVYGTQGVANSNNTPGSRQRPAAWTDSSGNVWLYGGFGYATTGTAGYLSDLWKLDMKTLQWTWMSGNNVITKPGTFGTQGVAAASNNPGALAYSFTWTDGNGNFWLFGGFGYAQVAGNGYLDDVWKYSPSTGQWTWVSGDGVINKTTVYGTVGVETASNHLGGRDFGGRSWIDGSGNFWLFGGYGEGTTATLGSRNDFWRFNPSNGNWTWMGGSTAATSAAVYNTLGAVAPGNDPGGRGDEALWIDGSGNIWLFGGSSTPPTATTGRTPNDLWNYQLSAAAQPVISPGGGTYNFDQTVTITDSTSGAVMYYTTDGTTPTIHSTVYSAPITVNTPQTIQAIAASSGYSYSPVASEVYKFVRLTAATPVIGPVSGSYAPAPTVTISDATPGSTIYYTTNGTTPTTNSAVYGGPFTVSLPSTVEAIAVASQYSNSAVAVAAYTQPVVATPVISPASGSYPTPLSSITITDTTPGATIYYTTDGSTPTTSSPIYSGPFSIVFSATIQAFAVESGYITSGTARTVYTVVQPTPVISSVSPVSPFAFTPNNAFTLMINGSGFVSTSVIFQGVTPLVTQYVSSTQLTAQVPATLTNVDPAKVGGLGFTVNTPGAPKVSSTVTVAAISANYASMPITISPTTATVTAGSSASFSIAVGNSASFVSAANAVNLPTDTQAGWAPDPYLTNNGVLAINTSSTTPKGTYTILILCNGSVPASKAGGMFLPILLLPLLLLRKKLAAKKVWLTLSAALILLVSALPLSGCAKGPSYGFVTTSTNEAVNAAQITLTVQ